jgi:hypothetical protein
MDPTSQSLSRNGDETAIPESGVERRTRNDRTRTLGKLGLSGAGLRTREREQRKADN